MDGDLASMERRFGETVAALREKVKKVELDAANIYLRRHGFYKVQEQIAQAMEKMQQSIDGRFVRIEEKLELRDRH